MADAKDAQDEVRGGPNKQKPSVPDSADLDRPRKEHAAHSVSQSKWQETIPEGTLRSFRRQYKYILTVLPRMGGWMFSAPFKSHCETELATDVRFPLSPGKKHRIASKRRELVRRRDRFDPLLILFQEWGDAERTPDEVVIIEDNLMDKAGKLRIQKNILHMPPEGEKARLQAQLKRSIKNITSLLPIRFTPPHTTGCRSSEHAGLPDRGASERRPSECVAG